MGDVTVPFGLPYPVATDLVRDGAADIEALAEGVNDQLALGFVYVGTRYYTSSGTFVKADPFGDSSFAGAKMRAIRVRLVGAGGGGGGVASTGAGQAAQSGGGSGGGYAESFITDIAGLDASVTVTRGAGGNGGAAGANNGSSGGSSSFGTAVVAGGGGIGLGSAATSTFPAFDSSLTPGVGTAGQLLARGHAANAGVLTSNSPAGTFARLGAAGGSVLSGGATSGINVAGTQGLLGAGGNGVWNQASQTAKAGGAGGNGIVIVDVFA